jgi:hypothetical protein
MSTSTCARSGGAVLYAAARNPEIRIYWALIEMQREQDAFASRPTTSHRVVGRTMTWRGHQRRRST